MTLFSELCAAYDVLSQTKELAPPFHAQRSAGVEISLDDDGGFISARRLFGESVLIPVTARSEVRTSFIAPHPLCDILRYVAADLPDEKGNSAYFAAYEKQLSDWASSPFTCSETEAVLAYIRRRRVYSDLVESGALDGVEAAIAPKLLVCFSVGGVRLHESEKIRRFFISLCENQSGERAYSFSSGRLVPSAESFPSGILPQAYRAKLVSANDVGGFTFRGRFSERSQAFSVGTSEAQRAHIALRRLAQTPAYISGNAVYLLWRTNGEKPLNFFTEALTAEDFHACPSPLPQAVLIKIEPTSIGRLAVRYFHKSDMSGVMYWLEACSWTFGGNKKTPPLHSFAELCGGDIVDLLLPCVLERHIVPKSVLKRVCSAILKNVRFGSSEYIRKLETACTLVSKRRIDCGGSVLSPVLSEAEEDSGYLFGRIFALLYATEKRLAPKHSTTQNTVRNATQNEKLNSTQIVTQITAQNTKQIAAPKLYGRSRCENALFSFSVRPVRTLAALKNTIRFSDAPDGEKLLDELNGLIRRISPAEFTDKPLSFTFLCGLYCQLRTLGFIRQEPRRASKAP